MSIYEKQGFDILLYISVSCGQIPDPYLWYIILWIQKKSSFGKTNLLLKELGQPKYI